MAFENVFSILIFSLLLGCIGYFLGYSRMNRDVKTIKERIPLSSVLTAVSEEMIKAHIKSEERGFAVMEFDECEFEFAVETEEQEGGKVTLWALEISGGAKQTESNKVRIKYKNIEGAAWAAAQEVEDAEDEAENNVGENPTP